MDGECAALAAFAFHGDIAALDLSNVLDNGKPRARFFLHGCSRNQ